MTNLSKPKSLLLIDLDNVFWTFALGNASDPMGYTLSEIRSLAKNYDRTILCVGGPQKSFRSVIWSKYKADRKSRPEHLWRLLESTIQHLEAEGYHVFRAGRHRGYDEDVHYEADDVIGTCVAWAKEREIPCDILSGDSDLTQLVDDGFRVRMLRRYKGITPLDESGVVTWLGVPPVAVVELKALAGDGGDGYGDTFPGIGDGKAIQLLKLSGWNALTAVKMAIASTKQSAIGDTIKRLGEDRLMIGYSLARIVCDVPSVPVEDIMTIKERKPLPSIAGSFVPDKPASAPAQHFDTSASPALVAAAFPAQYGGEADDGPSSRDLAMQEMATPPAIHRRDPVAPSFNMVPPRREGIQDAEFSQETGEVKSTALAIATPSEMADAARWDQRMLVSPAEARRRLQEFQAFVNDCLINGKDYGTIPGCGDKPALYKSGAEKIAEIFGLAIEYIAENVTERWDDDSPFFFYRYRCVLRRKSDGLKVSECIASCNSKEDKFGSTWAYERNVPSHLDKDRLRKRVMKQKNPRPNEPPTYTMFSVPNERIFNAVNSIDKMAQKRAMVGAVLLATRASGVFAADIDDTAIRSNRGEVSDDHQWD